MIASGRSGFKEGTIYRTRGARDRYSQAPPHSSFDITFDNTDHFSFHCHSCGSDANSDAIIEEVKAVGTQAPTLYFELRCKQCGAIGTRKIYLI